MRMIKGLAALAAVLVLALTGCTGEIWLRNDGPHLVERADIMFVCETDRAIGSVGTVTELSTDVGGNAGREPLYRGETLSFGVYQWPVTLKVFSDLEATCELARIDIGEAPPAGERWLVAAMDAPDGIALELSSQHIHNSPDGED